MTKKKEVTISSISTTTNMETTTGLNIKDIQGLEESLDFIRSGFDVAFRQTEETATNIKEVVSQIPDIKTAINELEDALTSLTRIVQDVDFRRTEFEVGDIVLSKNLEMKGYRRGRVVGFGTGKRIIIATLFGHFIANESDTFLVERQPKESKK